MDKPSRVVVETTPSGYGMSRPDVRYDRWWAIPVTYCPLRFRRTAGCLQAVASTTPLDCGMQIPERCSERSRVMLEEFSPLPSHVTARRWQAAVSTRR